MKEFFNKTFADLTTAAPLDICGIGEAALTPRHLSCLYAVVHYRYENLLPTTTHTDKNPLELCKAICNTGDPVDELLAHAIVGRLWEMGVERSSRICGTGRGCKMAEEAHIVKDFQIGNTRIKIADNYCRTGDGEVERILRHIVELVQRQFDTAAKK